MFPNRPVTWSVLLRLGGDVLWSGTVVINVRPVRTRFPRRGLPKR